MTSVQNRLEANTKVSSINRWLGKLDCHQILIYNEDRIITSYDEKLNLLRTIPLDDLTNDDLYRLENHYNRLSTFLDEYVADYGNSKSINLTNTNECLVWIRDVEWLKSFVRAKEEAEEYQYADMPDSYYEELEQLEKLESSEEYQSYKAEEDYLARESEYYYLNYDPRESFEEYLARTKLDESDNSIDRLRKEDQEACNQITKAEATEVDHLAKIELDKFNDCVKDLKEARQFKKAAPDYLYIMTGRLKKQIREYCEKEIPLSKIGISGHPKMRRKEVFRKESTFVEEIKLIYKSPTPLYKCTILESYLLDYFLSKKIDNKEWVVVPPEKIIEKITEVLDALGNE